MSSLLRTCIRRMVKLLALFITIWLILFASFISKTQKNYNDQVMQDIDAVVVLTGDDKRIEHGISIFETQQISHIYISGVHEKFSRNNLQSYRRCCFVFGYQANDTRGNVIEVHDWLKKNNFRRIALVTSDYHMPRALSMFEKAMSPHISIYPIPTHYGTLASILKKPRQFKVVFLEFHKYMLYRFFGIEAVSSE